MNRVTSLFGIRYPIIQGGMVWCSGWRLAAAVSNARQAKPSRTPFGKGFFQNSQQLSCQHGACTTVIKYRGSIE